MNNNIIEMIKKGILIVGKTREIDGFTLFERITLDEAINTDPANLAYATPSMGRGVFKIGSNNEILNIKGVDSHLANSENAVNNLSGAKTKYLITDGSLDYKDSTHPINLVIFPGKATEKADIRIRGTSPLEDLELEGDINSKLKKIGIKVPQIESIREYPIEVAKKLGLPIKVKSRSDDIQSSYHEEDIKRKAYLREVYGRAYAEEEIEGYRPEYIREYFERLKISDDIGFIEFAENNGLTVELFTDAVDSSYSAGQRYGQTIRVLDSPFRISDLEYYIENRDAKSLEEIATFTNSHSNDSLPFEVKFARQLGENVANLMNNGWVTDNLKHRQDVSILGEMCDDSYVNLKEINNSISEYQSTNPSPEELAKKHGDLKNKEDTFFFQFMHFTSCIKILQEEMKLRHLPDHAIENIMNEYINSFAKTIDFTKVGESLNVSREEAEQRFKKMLSSKDFARDMSREIRGKDEYKYDEQVILCHENNNEFYTNTASKVATKLNIELDNEHDIINKLISLKDDEIMPFLMNRLKELEQSSTESRNELSMFTIGCSRFNRRNESPEVIGYIPSRVRLKKLPMDLSAFKIDDINLYVEAVKLLRSVNPNKLFHNDVLLNNRIMDVIQATICKYFGLSPTEENREKIYSNYSDVNQEDNSFSIRSFRDTQSAMCVERSAAAQNLLAFFGYNPMLVFGYSSSEKGGVNVGHVFNVILRNGKGKLVDFSNPIFNNGKFKRTAIFNLTGEQLESFKRGRGAVELEFEEFHNNEETTERRVYSSDEISPQYFEKIKEDQNKEKGE